MSVLQNSLSNLGLEIAEILATSFNQQDRNYTLKSDASPITQVELEVHRRLVSGLSKMIPAPIVSEESFDSVNHSKCWLVDPLDGTKEFINGLAHFTTNIAFLIDSIPVVGMIIVPAASQMYYAERGHGAWEWKASWQPLQRQNPPEASLITSRSHSKTDEQLFKNHFQLAKSESCGSALKFVKLAKEEASVYPRLVPCRSWDVAAGHCLLEETGGRIVHLRTGQSLQYAAPWNQPVTPFVALSASYAHREITTPGELSI